MDKLKKKVLNDTDSEDSTRDESPEYKKPKKSKQSKYDGEYIA